MTLNELIKKAADITEEYYDGNTWKGFTETILRDLNPIAKLYISEEVESELANEYMEIDLSDLENSFFEILTVQYMPTGGRRLDLKKLSIHDVYSTGWVKENEQIRLQNIPYGDGSVIINGYGYLILEEDEDDYILNLPERYHETLLKGIMTLSMQKEEELDRKNDFMGEYMMLKRQMQFERVVEMEPWLIPNSQGGIQ